MAEKRMFAKSIVTSDAFLDMPASARCLYFILCMFADDDGFVNNPRSIMRQCGAHDDDMKILVAKSFVLLFETGVIVIKHWRIHNYIQKDRYHPTKYQEEMSLLTENKNGGYSLDTTCIQTVSNVDTTRIQSVSNMDTEVRLNKVSKGKDILSGPQCAKIEIQAKEVIDYLNEKTGSHYRYSESSLKHIRARLNDGFTVDDCKTVIDKKVTEWMGDSLMQKYLRPETLFGSKYENYLNAPEAKPRGEVLPDWYDPNPRRRDQQPATPEEIERVKKLLGGNPHERA